MNGLTRLTLVASVAALTAAAQAQPASSTRQPTPDNWADGTGTGVWMNGTNELCWRDASWTPATADARCDGALDAPQRRSEGPPPMTTDADHPSIQADALFDFDKSSLKPHGKEKLDELAGRLSTVNLEVVVVTGYTDRTGAVAYNDGLSLRRALAVKAYLVSKGVPAGRIYAEGKGSRNPITAGCNDKSHMKLIACLAPDRRVEVEVAGTIRR
ncbi:OmpA family protein [Burkholderia pyrrocinia]|uniref:outer membrane protein OmpA n=1 Tax=Burkholderia pyrrocinia TaxID=60550 RepID=UPI001576F267|nr:OmpA family protein [Burkholderia pyrrocinia]NTX26679.1 OmpA family protein [Burkholderia pyrrocinia]